MDDLKKILRPLLLSFIAYILGLIYIQRHETMLLLPWFLFLFAEYLVIYLKCENENQVRIAVIGSVVFRITLFFSLPILSDDFYRFLWDGHLLNAGINPFNNTPSEIMEMGTLSGETTNRLYQSMNSPNYHTIYPPVNQFIFFLSTFLFPNSIVGSVFVIRFFLFLGEIGSLLLFFKLARVYRIPKKNILLYAVNPLVIMEITGNLHFEGLMIFFILLALLLLKSQRLNYSGLFYGLAISTKLIPLIGWILFLKRIKLQRSLLFFLISGGVTLILFLGFLSKPFLLGMLSSVSLYFQKFEFNASIYYLVREIGYAFSGYNIIRTAGLWLALFTLILIGLYALYESNKKVNYPTALMVVWTLYLFLSTTVHPWYILPLIAFSIFSRYRYPVAWSLLIFFTYANYRLEEYREVMWIVIAEYGVLTLFIYWELRRYVFSLESKLSKNA